MVRAPWIFLLGRSHDKPPVGIERPTSWLSGQSPEKLYLVQAPTTLFPGPNPDWMYSRSNPRRAASLVRVQATWMSPPFPPLERQFRPSRVFAMWPTHKDAFYFWYFIVVASTYRHHNSTAPTPRYLNVIASTLHKTPSLTMSSSSHIKPTKRGRTSKLQEAARVTKSIKSFFILHK